jgi:ABC-type polysaccharide/polyol phosphate transport system ATPase subunit
MPEAQKTVQAARALDDFVIKQFRGLKDVSLRQLGLINLLVGGNNSGKTTILEALAVFSAPLDIGVWSNIARNREVMPVPFLKTGLNAAEAVRWLFPQQDGMNATAKVKSDFHLTCTGKWDFEELRAHCESARGIPPEPLRRLNQQYDDPNGLLEGEGWEVSAELTGKGMTSGSTKVLLWPTLGYRDEQDAGDRPHIPAVILAPYSHRNQPLQMRRLSELIESDEKLTFVELLQDLDPDVRDLHIVTDRYTGVPTILVKHNRSGSVPISVMGDGFRRALAIALSIPSVQGGLLLIDEIETALHVSFLQKLFSWLIRTCEASNVQLFATTHSLEAVSAMVNATPTAFTEGITTYHLDAQAPTKRYSSEMLARLVRDRGLDIR